MTLKLKIRGVTLLEMLLAMVIFAGIILMIVRFQQQKIDNLRRTKMVAQMQQVLSAAQAYYVQNKYWPTSLSDLQLTTDPNNPNPTYLPTAGIRFVNPWGKPFLVWSAANTPSIRIYSDAGSYKEASIIAGMIPFGFTNSAGSLPPAAAVSCATTDTSCYVAITASPPAQNTNKAREVSFTGLYKTGGCVPMPDCPMDKNGIIMTPQIMVVPVQVSGIYSNPSAQCNLDANGNANCGGNQVNMSPLTGWSAIATTGFDPMRPQACPPYRGWGYCHQDTDSSGLNGWLPFTASPGNPKGYWRVCLVINTEQGAVNPSQAPAPSATQQQSWGQLTGSVLAIVRCGTPKEQSGGYKESGSTLNVWTP